MARWPHAVSTLLHGGILAWVATAPQARGPHPRSLYEQEIAPHRDKLVWYTFRGKLPEVSPLERRGPSQPPRVEAKAPQVIVAQPPRGLPAPQLVWRPLPEIQLPRELRSPNLVAVSPPQQPKAFVPPRESPRAPLPRPSIAEPPRLEVASARPAPFETGVTPSKPRPRAFRAPAARTTERPALPVLADPGLQVAAARNGPAPLFHGAGPQRPKFTAPPTARSQPAQAAAPTVLEDAPAIAVGGGAGNLNAAIVGLNPAPELEAPLPDGSRPARLSAGPQPGTGRGSGEPVESARIFVPDLMVRNGPRDANPTLVARATAPTAMENLRAAVQGSRVGSAAHRQAVKVSGGPLPDFQGRPIYSMTVQMPNVTSYYGSWIIWFAERAAPTAAGGLQPPVPLRKVDPKYVASAADDRVEGKVRLAAVIRKDGHVDSVALVARLDERLDRSAEEALAKWQFEPALRGGTPVEVDAVVEIPFRLRPREAR